MKSEIDNLVERFSNSKSPILDATFFVRDIPYGDIGSRDPEDIVKTHMGTCSGKHFLLKEIYSQLGFEVKDMMAIHRFNDLEIKLNEELKELLDQNDVRDPHNFLSVLVNKRWLMVDITWDKALGKIGLEINEDWDGKSDMRLGVNSDNYFEVDNGLDYKKRFIKELSQTEQNFRRKYIKKFGEYLAEVRTK